MKGLQNFAIGAVLLGLGILAVPGAIAGVIMVGQPFRIYIAEYTVRAETLRGEAELRRAEQNRQIQVEQAQAERDAATLRAEAIEIVGQAAKDYPEYRYQEFLGGFTEALRAGTVDQIIYVPTEAGIPVMEAGRMVSQP